jgi:hypothetical protein
MLLAIAGCQSSASSQPLQIPPSFDLYRLDTGDPNLNLWNTVNGKLLILRANYTPDFSGADAGFPADAYALSMMDIPTRNADPELLEWSAQVIRSVSEHGRIQQFLTGPQANGEGNAVGPKEPPKNPNRLGFYLRDRWLETAVSIRERGNELQKTLSARYNRNFLPCAF